jgi:ABC-2 type transport system permease protein
MNFTVLKSIFRRDFVSYFSNPTGYVFICVFVMLSALAAFWPPDFFSNNLANLDQLTKWLPFILLVFIPAITMSIWAEERRQHTDELLLTLPASDVDVVFGKYLAAVAIYTVALLFSMFSIYLVFMYGLGDPDGGLFIGTYIGYWFIGLAMLAIGMVASFLTGNLTVGFILGMIFNLPLAMFGVADWIIKDPQLAQAVKRWSAQAQFQDFERGVISLGGISYFVMIAAICLYLSMVLIGRRHWGGRDANESMWAHYLARTLGLVALAIGVNLFFSHHNGLRADITSEKLNSPSPRTIQLVEELRDDDKVKPIKIDAYVSPQVPAEYAAHKLNLLSTLAELSSLSGGKILVDVHEVENFSDEASNAEKAYGIEPREVMTIDRGARKMEEIFLGAAFSSGLDRVVIPFIDKGIPVEYELLRSICTVADQKRAKLGVVKTGVQLFGGFSMQGQTEESQLVAELKKQYDVVEVDPAKEIKKDDYDVLLAVQPSSLTPEEMEHFVAAVKSGVPTAIFEDPFPLTQPGVVGTAQPNRPEGGPMGGMFGGGGPPKPKGDISKLWNLLGVEMDGNKIVWQEFNPEPKLGDIFPEWVFIDESLGDGAFQPFAADDEISKGMKQLLFFWAGSFRPANNAKLDFKKLAVTGRETGTVDYHATEAALQSRDMMAIPRDKTNDPYIIAAHIKGKVAPDADLFLKDTTKDAKKDENPTPGEAASAAVAKDPEDANVDVVLVADIDWIAPDIFRVREMGANADWVTEFKFQNVPFVLNILDGLAGDDRFIDLRKRSRSHRILTKVDEATEEYRTKSLDDQTKAIAEARKQIEEAERALTKQISDIENNTQLDPRIRMQQAAQARIELESKRNMQVSRLEKQRNQDVKKSERELAAKIRGVQDRYKLLAVLLPPIPPILLAFFVFFHRRKAEREGVDASRLRYGKSPTEATAARAHA